MSQSPRHFCPVCAWDQLEEAPWGEDGKTPSYDICPCCGVEFGNEDADPGFKARARERWIASGGEWFEPAKKPRGWSFEEQLKRIRK